MIVCKQCKKRMTWRDQRTQFSRMVGRGISKLEIKEIQPLCSKCVTSYLKNKSVFEIEDSANKPEIQYPLDWA